MLKLRKILLCNYLYYLLLIITFLYCCIAILNYNKNETTKYSNEYSGKIVSIRLTNYKTQIIIKGKNKVLVNINKKIPYLKQGMKIKVKGKLVIPEESTVDNTFNYKNYLKTKKISFIISTSDYEIINNNISFYYKIKNFISKSAEDNPYLKAFILGDKSDISKNVNISYQENGISHLFAISGMHISLISNNVLKLLKKMKIKENSRYYLTIFILIIYLSLLKESPSALRGVLFFIFFSLNKMYYLNVKSSNLFIVVLSITLFINPFYIYDVGFQYSFIISITLLLMKNYINGKYFISLLRTSFIAFVISMPISLYNYYQINLLSIIYNLFFVPYISYIIMPLTIMTFIYRPLLPIYKFLIKILENISLFLNQISITKIIFKKLNFIFYLLYFIFIIIFLYSLNKRKKPLFFIPLILLMIIHYFYNLIFPSTYIKMIDIGQGDSILIHSNNESILIDTGGKMFSNTSHYAIPKTIPMFKSLGIKKLKYLILTHGDSDHMKEAKYFVKNFQVQESIINLGYENHLERDFRKYTKNISVGYEERKLFCGEIELIQLNKKFYNENDSSQIYLGKYKNIYFLMTGDASILSEETLLSKYDIPRLDILKVGHHGSKTSTSKLLLEQTRPKIALISAGLNNKFHHPHKTVIDKLKEYNVKYFETSIYGTITVDLNKRELYAYKGKYKNTKIYNF